MPLESAESHDISTLQSRSATDLERESLLKKLQYLKLALNEQYIKAVRKVNLPMFTPAKLHCIFGAEQIEQILKQSEHIFYAFTFGGAKRSGSARECKYFPIGMNPREPLWR